MAYLAVLVRIVLFKQAPLYSLFSAAGSVERAIGVIPFKSLYDMVISGASVIRILENVGGNIAIFIPLGLLLPIIQKDRPQKVILCGLAVSMLFEIIQYALALGSSDIDDLIFNTSGVMIGYLLYKIVRLRSHTDITAGFSTIVLGITALGVLFISHTELFMLSEKKVVVENEELIQDFIDLPPAFAGKLVEVNEEAGLFAREKSNVQIWSLAGNTVYHLIIFKSV